VGVLAAGSGATEATDAASGRKASKCFDAGSAPVTIGAPWTVTGGGSADLIAVEQAKVVEFEINNGCGLRVGPRERVGIPLAVVVRDNAGSPAQASAITSELISRGAAAVVAGGGSPTAVASGQAAVLAGIPFGATQAAGDALSGCTPAELADPAVTPSTVPVYAPGQCWNHRGLAFRTTATTFEWGRLAAEYARTTFPARTTAAIVFRDDDTGRPNRDGLRSRFVELGGTVLAEGGFNSTTATVAELKTLLRTVTAGNPSIVLGSNTTSRLRNLMQAYVELRDDSTWTAKPANFDSLRFVWASTLSANYSDLGAAALAALAGQSTILQPAWDPESVAYKRWFALYRSYNPAAQPASSGFILSAYDALIVMSLAITAAETTDPAAVAAQIKRVASPPGRVICPGQWTKAFRLLDQGKDINYEGALGPVDFDERGNATGLTYGVFRVQPAGPTELESTLGTAAQPRCSGGEEGG
jgi:branched-chain amino acid transport system substrate-binding protein